MQPEQESQNQWQQPNESNPQAPFQVTNETPPEDGVVTDINADTAPVDLGNESENSVPSDASESQDDAVLVRWESLEYTQREKTTVWYVIFLVVIILVTILAVVIIKSITFAILVPVAGVALYIYTRHQPEMLQYTLSRKGLYINDKLYQFDQFKSFGLLDYKGVHSAVLIPRKRFQVGQTVYFPEDIGEQLVDMLASRLPMNEVKPDLIDKMLNRLKL